MRRKACLKSRLLSEPTVFINDKSITIQESLFTTRTRVFFFDRLINKLDSLERSLELARGVLSCHRINQTLNFYFRFAVLVLFRTITVSSVQNLSSSRYSDPPLILFLFFSFKFPCFTKKRKTRTWTAVSHNSRIYSQWDSSSSSTIFGRPKDWAWRKFEADLRLLPNHGLGLHFQRWDARIIKKTRREMEGVEREKTPEKQEYRILW